MTDVVKGWDQHVALLLGSAFERIRRSTDGPQFRGLRQSHLRVVDTIDPAGSRAVDLARRLRMTKQGVGQLVATLVRLGLLEQVPDPADRRARLLVLTRDGLDLRHAVTDQLAALEQRWADDVGPVDYATFRRVLTAIAVQSGSEA